MTTTDVRTFTPEQQAVIDAPMRPVLVVAGAGTGKTTVMAQRILHLVQEGLARQDEILGLTFTNKAAYNLKQKVRDPAALGPDADVTVSTYHSFGASIVAEHALEVGLDAGTQVLNRAQSWQLLYTVFDEFRFRQRRTLSPRVVLDDALVLASRCADHLIAVETLVADCQVVIDKGRWKMPETAEKRLELCQVVAAYERRKQERNLIDFGDQVRLAVRLLTERPDIAEAYRQQHPVVLLDEYQDTNFAQRRMLQLIYPPGSSVTAVGDDMQSIYAFRGAHLANILRFAEHFPPVKTLPLQTTFRFGARLVELANRIQGRVGQSLERTLAARPGSDDTAIECFLAADEAEEAVTIADDIGRRGQPWADNAVLCRKRRLIPAIVTALEDRGIPVEVVGTSGLLDRPEVVDLVAWLEVLADPAASVALLRILEGPRYRIGLRDLAALARHARRPADDTADDTAAPLPPAVLGDVLDQLDSITDLSDAARARLGRFRDEQRLLGTAAGRLPVLDLAETIILRTGLWHAAGAKGRENLLRFLDLAERFAPVEGDPGLPAFVEYLRLLDESDEDLAEAHPSDDDAVKVMTIHQAKGLEFDVVYVPGLAGSRGSSRVFPDNRAGENALSNSSALPWWLQDDDEIGPWEALTTKAQADQVIQRRKLDEEWRLLYVACTRARRRLVCSAAHWYWDVAEPQGPSSFYEFVAGQGDLVTERFRRPPADTAPAIAARQRHRDGKGSRYAEAVASDPAQLRLDDVEMSPLPPRRVPTALSVTGLVTYARCPKQFYWSVVRPLPRRNSAAARLGVEVHRWIEQRAGRQLSLMQPDDEPQLDPDVLPPGEGVAARLKASFLDSVFGALDPLRVEAPFVLPLGDHLVRGRIDAVYERDDRLELVDFKTGRRAAQGDRSATMQLDLYALGAVSTWRAEPRRLRTTYCYLSTGGAAELVSVDWDDDAVERVRTDLHATLDALAGARYSPTPGSWCRGCDFLAFCPAGQAQTAQTPPPPSSA